MSRQQQSGAHRDVHVPWRISLTCRLFGHAEPFEHLTNGWVLCTRCTPPLAEGDVIDHLCRNPPCVNPQHLDVVTNRENVLRGMSPTAVVHRQRRCGRGHAIEGNNVYTPAKYPTQRHCRECRNRNKRASAARSRKATA